MAASCPIPTPTEAIYGAILDKAQRAMRDTILAAVEAAQATAAAELRAAGLDDAAFSSGFFTSVANRTLFAKLCGADPEIFAGDDAQTALAVIKNCQAIARHRWGAGIPN